MRKSILTLAVLAVVAFANVASAQNYGYRSYGGGFSGSSTRIGNHTFYNFSNGFSGSANRIGNHTFYNFSNGFSGSANRIGNHTFYNFNSYRTPRYGRRW